MKQTTIHDLLKLSKPSTGFENGNQVIKELEKEFDKDDLIITYFFFRDDLWLINNEMFDVAGLHILVTLEERLRKKGMELKLDKPEMTEKQAFNKLINIFGDSKEITRRTKAELNNLRKIRNIYVHTNMAKAEKILKVKGSGLEEYLLNHELKRMNLKEDFKHTKSILLLSVKKRGFLVISYVYQMFNLFHIRIEFGNIFYKGAQFALPNSLKCPAL